MNTQELIRDQMINGLATTYSLALKNRLILKELKNIQPKLKKVRPSHIDEMFLYLRDCSKNETILNISKLYEKSNHRKTRSINKLIIEIVSNKIEIINDVYFLEKNWLLFLVKHKKIINKVPELKTSPDCFFKIIEKVIHDFEQKENLIGQVRIWRDKFIAHNERTDLKIRFDDEDIDTLLELAFYILDFINFYVVTGSYVTINVIKPNFVTEYFKQYIEQDLKV